MGKGCRSRAGHRYMLGGFGRLEGLGVGACGRGGEDEGWLCAGGGE